MARVDTKVATRKREKVSLQIRGDDSRMSPSLDSSKQWLLDRLSGELKHLEALAMLLQAFVGPAVSWHMEAHSQSPATDNLLSRCITSHPAVFMRPKRSQAVRQ